MEKMHKTEEDWKKELTPEEYHVLREKGTDPAFRNEYWDVHEDGDYYCRACGHKLFDSGTKFDSGTGWPSFTAPAEEDAVQIEKDTSFGMERNEVVCSNCGSHLGHVFPDGPGPTHERFCMNSTSLKFKQK